jgi:hypothetical protein
VLNLDGLRPDTLKSFKKCDKAEVGSSPAFDFPHQSTLDQFFDEEQFEAYRQLGVHVAEGLFSPALAGSDPAPTTVNDWFGRLSRRLLLPEN